MLKQYQDLIDSTKLYSINGMSLRVKVLDVKSAWNRIDCLISPIEGYGTRWVSIDSLLIDKG